MGITKARYSRSLNERNSRHPNLKRLWKARINLKSRREAQYVSQIDWEGSWPWDLKTRPKSKGKRWRVTESLKIPGKEKNWGVTKRRNQACWITKTWTIKTRGGRKKTVARTVKTMRRRARTSNQDRMRAVRKRAVAMNPQTKIQSCWRAVSPCLKQPLRLLPASLKTVWGVLELKVMRSEEDWQCGCPECAWMTLSSDTCTLMKQFSVRRMSKCGHSSSNSTEFKEL